jgi:inositol-1,3,4-trisphosphate 5/6-kinase/inositol-tetrakisphosphate 1-kinase
MAVVMDYHGLQTVLEDKVPCLCQEYTNHDASLFKVYVLGEHVSVHKRRSLPNIPRNQKSTRSFVEFDSQRPYPRLSDFGFSSDSQIFVEEEIARKRRRSHNKTSFSPNATPSTVTSYCAITTDEVMPIVAALKEAFGLELFGFDILVACDDEDETRNHDNQGTSRDSIDAHKRMLVVDVNYFPSYKEVPNFPWLLAKYLTDRALENRRANCCQDVPVDVNTNR